MDEEGRNWDVLLLSLYILFAVQEASTGFSPFELLFGKQPRGLLDVAKKAWEKQSSPFHSIPWLNMCNSYRATLIGLIFREHMEQAQKAQQRVYNQPVQPCEIQTSGQVLPLVPGASWKFLACWQGLYIVIEKVSPVNYCLQQSGKFKDTQVYHIY